MFAMQRCSCQEYTSQVAVSLGLVKEDPSSSDVLCGISCNADTSGSCCWTGLAEEGQVKNSGASMDNVVHQAGVGRQGRLLQLMP